jgi:hypothetical protein
MHLTQQKEMAPKMTSRRFFVSRTPKPTWVKTFLPGIDLRAIFWLCLPSHCPGWIEWLSPVLDPKYRHRFFFQWKKFGTHSIENYDLSKYNQTMTFNQ